MNNYHYSEVTNTVDLYTESGILDFCTTVNSLNCRHFGAGLCSFFFWSVLYSGGRVISSPICVVITAIMLFYN